MFFFIQQKGLQNFRLWSGRAGLKRLLSQPMRSGENLRARSHPRMQRAVIMRNKFLGTGEPGFHPFRKIRIMLAGLRFVFRYEFSVAYKLVPFMV